MLNSERIIGYNTYSNILDKEKVMATSIEDADYYNVTVNFVVKKGNGAAEPT